MPAGTEPGRATVARSDETVLGVSPPVAAMLCYLGFWVSGALLLVLERRQPFVRFHAAQSVVAFGLLSAVGLTAGLATTVALFLHPAIFHAMTIVTELLWLGILLLWAGCLVKTLRGDPCRLPGAAGLADRLTGR